MIEARLRNDGQVSIIVSDADYIESIEHVMTYEEFAVMYSQVCEGFNNLRVARQQDHEEALKLHTEFGQRMSERIYLTEVITDPYTSEVAADNYTFAFHHNERILGETFKVTEQFPY